MKFEEYTSKGISSIVPWQSKCPFDKGSCFLAKIKDFCPGCQRAFDAYCAENGKPKLKRISVGHPKELTPRQKFWAKVKEDEKRKYTVGELLIELAKYPVDATISILATADCHYIFAGGRNLQIMEEDNHITLFNDEDWDFYEKLEKENEE